jgi:glucosylceramidase
MGLNYTVGRLHMNSCDFSIDSYSCDDVEGDYTLQNFNIARDKKFITPFVQAAINNTRFYNPNHKIQFFLSPWSPPAWMKINHEMNGSALPNGLINSTQVYQSWALFYSKFIKSYKQEGIDIWGLTIQNESEFAAPWEGMSNGMP